MTTDLVVTTYNRLETLKMTLEYIWERTSTPYRLIVVDDCSTEDTKEYLRELEAVGKVDWIYLRDQKVGMHHYLDDMLDITSSDPIVFTDDDILCPLVEPDWLSQGLKAMQDFPNYGLIALNNPYENWAKRRALKQPGKVVTTIHAVGGTFAFVRREILKACVGPDKVCHGNSPMLSLSWRIWMTSCWKVGYLSEVYCQHNQGVSARTGQDSSSRLAKVPPMDLLTLEPSERYRR